MPIIRKTLALPDADWPLLEELARATNSGGWHGMIRRIARGEITIETTQSNRHIRVQVISDDAKPILHDTPPEARDVVMNSSRHEPPCNTKVSSPTETPTPEPKPRKGPTKFGAVESSHWIPVEV